MLAALAVSACKTPETMHLHYLPGFVPGSEQIFHPAAIAVTRPTGQLADGAFRVGAVYDANGNEQQPLYVGNLGDTIDNAVLRALADAGLKPVSVDPPPADGKPPPGSDFILSTVVEQVSVDKHFGARQTVHGQYFRMKATVRLKFTLSTRTSPGSFAGETTGIEQEPPTPVGHEEFLPLETNPAESLSVAMSRAVGLLMLQKEFRSALPLRSPG